MAELTKRQLYYLRQELLMRVGCHPMLIDKNTNEVGWLMGIQHTYINHSTGFDFLNIKVSVLEFDKERDCWTKGEYWFDEHFPFKICLKELFWEFKNDSWLKKEYSPYEWGKYINEHGDYENFDKIDPPPMENNVYIGTEDYYDYIIYLLNNQYCINEYSKETSDAIINFANDEFFTKINNEYDGITDEFNKFLNPFVEG